MNSNKRRACLRVSAKGTLSNHEGGFGNYSATSKHNLALSYVFRDYSILFTLFNIGEVSCSWTELKITNDRLAVVCSRCRQDLKFRFFRRCFAGNVTDLCKSAC